MEAAVGVRKGGPTSEKLRYAMAVAQHHDAVSGTSKQVSDVPDTGLTWQQIGQIQVSIRHSCASYRSYSPSVICRL